MCFFLRPLILPRFSLALFDVTYARKVSLSLSLSIRVNSSVAPLHDALCLSDLVLFCLDHAVLALHGIRERCVPLVRDSSTRSCRRGVASILKACYPL